MARQIIIFIMMLAAAPVFSQADLPVLNDTLVKLNKPIRVVHKYVNFDVAKLMLGRGMAPKLPVRNAGNLAIRFQYLYPYARFKNIFPVGMGVTIGYDKIALRNAAFQFSGDNLDTIIKNPSVKKTKQRWATVGFIVLPIFRFNRVTILTGASLDLHFDAKLIQISGSNKQRTGNLKQLRPFSVPLHFQLSISKKQFAAFGFYAKYNTTPLYKGNLYQPVHPLTAGISGSLIF